MKQKRTCWLELGLAAMGNPQDADTPALQALQSAALEHFALPGDSSFPLNALYQGPKDRNEADILRQYISQMRQELALRLVNRLYADGTGKPSKWWLSFSKRRFMGKSL